LTISEPKFDERSKTPFNKSLQTYILTPTNYFALSAVQLDVSATLGSRFQITTFKSSVLTSTISFKADGFVAA